MIATKDNPSPLYLKCLQEATEHHATSKTYSGKFLRPHAPHIKRLLETIYIKPGTQHTLLDYGCGKGSQYQWISHGEEASIPKGMRLAEFWNADVYLYDPAYPPFAKEPPAGQQFDVVLCTHVLGSIPVTDLPWVLRELLQRAKVYVYIAEKIGPVSKQVFSEPERMPRWSAQQWRDELAALVSKIRGGTDALYPRVWFATREKTDEGVITEGVWI